MRAAVARRSRGSRSRHDHDPNKSLAKAFRILDCLGAHGPELGVTEISVHLGMNKSTVHRLLSALERFGLVEQAQEREKYSLGLKLLELGNLAVQSRRLQAQAHTRLIEMSRRANETVHLALLSDGDVVYLDKIEANNSLVSIPSAIGRRLPAHCTGLGKVLLASLKEQELDELLGRRELTRFTDRTITSRRELRRELQQVRMQGYALDQGEAERGLHCVAAPVFDHQKRIAAAISISGPSVRFQGQELEQKIALVKETALKISQGVGYRS
ncbi:MAG: IclR family transcriptional regulator [Acidobacteria bacterium]|nr:IclR family transcriptional regulator [Acidobacteriota bacterium]